MMLPRLARCRRGRTRLAPFALAGLALAGCAGVSTAPPKVVPVSHAFTLSVADTAAGCLVAAAATSSDPARACDGADRRCVRAQRGEVITFSAVGADFSVVFDPFGKHPHDVKQGKAEALTVVADAFETGAQPKTYTFYVTTTRPGCKPLDPKIIIQQ